MSLDILTPKGQKTLADELDAASLFEERTGMRYIRTPDDAPAKVDAVIVRDNRVIGVVETKCRYGVTREEMRSKWSDEWLVTMDKIEQGKNVAAAFGVPYYGFLYLVDEGVLLAQKIAGNDGQYCCRIRCDNTTTQRTVNGGSVVRCNAYIDLSGSKEWYSQKEWSDGTVR